MAVEHKRRRFTIDDYERMGGAGIFGEDDRVELIEGEIVDMTPIHAPHAGTINRGNRHLVGRLGDRAVIAVQNPLRLPPDDEPQPDLMVLRPHPDFYSSRNPDSGDVLLLVEVSDTTFRFDRRTKGRIYARYGIADYWIVNLQRNVLVVLRDPDGSDYRSERVLQRGETIVPLAFPDVEIAVVDLIP